MSGSPIIDQNGAAIGVVSVERSSPAIVDSLSAQLVRTILAEASGANPVPIRAMEDR
jgi:sensor histidine kinase regulating citrate/malate metabolism